MILWHRIDYPILPYAYIFNETYEIMQILTLNHNSIDIHDVMVQQMLPEIQKFSPNKRKKCNFLQMKETQP